MKIGCLICTRGDRGIFLKQAKRLIGRQTLQPDVVEVVDFKPVNNDVDLTKRCRIGYDRLTKKGMDVVVFWEDDDYYHPRYLELIRELMIRSGVDMVGIYNTIYYHLKLRKYKIMVHNTHASLFQTAIRTGLNINWPSDRVALLDTELWRDIRINRQLYNIENGCMGIKHGVGKTGGKGHNDDFSYKYDDPDLSYLRSMTGDQFYFYAGLSWRLMNGNKPA